VRILLVDDNGAAPAFSKPGHEVTVVKLGRDVPGKIREFKPDVIILDVPNANAVRIAKLLREDWPDVQIVVSHSSPSRDL
jgi:DNA-binding response OmpR family regulator